MLQLTGADGADQQCDKEESHILSDHDDGDARRSLVSDGGLAGLRDRRRSGIAALP